MQSGVQVTESAAPLRIMDSNRGALNPMQPYTVLVDLQSGPTVRVPKSSHQGLWQKNQYGRP